MAASPRSVSSRHANRAKSRPSSSASGSETRSSTCCSQRAQDHERQDRRSQQRARSGRVALTAPHHPEGPALPGPLPVTSEFPLQCPGSTALSKPGARCLRARTVLPRCGRGDRGRQRRKAPPNEALELVRRGAVISSAATIYHEEIEDAAAEKRIARPREPSPRSPGAHSPMPAAGNKRALAESKLSPPEEAPGASAISSASASSTGSCGPRRCAVAHQPSMPLRLT